jgi:hypothetical protein
LNSTKKLLTTRTLYFSLTGSIRDEEKGFITLTTNVKMLKPFLLITDRGGRLSVFMLTLLSQKLTNYKQSLFYFAGSISDEEKYFITLTANVKTL